jgi:hypothetical protein
VNKAAVGLYEWVMCIYVYYTAPTYFDNTPHPDAEAYLRGLLNEAHGDASKTLHPTLTPAPKRLAKTKTAHVPPEPLPTVVGTAKAPTARKADPPSTTRKAVTARSNGNGNGSASASASAAGKSVRGGGSKAQNHNPNPPSVASVASSHRPPPSEASGIASRPGSKQGGREGTPSNKNHLNDPPLRAQPTLVTAVSSLSDGGVLALEREVMAGGHSRDGCE